jgi:hypothetical protein
MNAPNRPEKAESEALQTLAALLEVIVCLDRHGFDELDELTPCLCGQHPPLPRQRIPLRGRAPYHELG